MGQPHAHPRFGWAGLAAGPAAWGLHTQIGYALTPWICAHHVNLVPWLAAGFAALALLGALVSFGVWRRTGPEHPSTQFIAAIGAPTGLLFALVIAMQGASGFFLTACER